VHGITPVPDSNVITLVMRPSAVLSRYTLWWWLVVQSWNCRLKLRDQLAQTFNLFILLTLTWRFPENVFEFAVVLSLKYSLKCSLSSWSWRVEIYAFVRAKASEAGSVKVEIQARIRQVGITGNDSMPLTTLNSILQFVDNQNTHNEIIGSQWGF